LLSSFLNIQNNLPNSKKSESPQKELYTKGKSLLKEFNLESAYQSFYDSFVISSKENDSLFITKSLYKLAKIDHYNKDYITCEHNLTKALQYIPSKLKYKYELLCYNLMGVNLKEKSNYKDAIIYFNKFRNTYLNKKDTLLQFTTYSNNMGMLYQKAGDYQKSIYYYNNVIQTSELKKLVSIKYARALDNKAWSLFKNKQYEKALPLFVQAKDIRKRIEDKPGLVMSYFHLGSFYQFKNQTQKAKEYSLQTLQVAENIGDLEGRLKALFLLSKIENTKSHLFFKQYKGLKDSLIEKERQFKHQSSRIRFETVAKEAEIRFQKIRIKSKNKIIFWITIAGLVFAFSSFLFFFQKRKIKEQKKHIQKLQTEVHHTAKNNLSMALKFVSKLKEKPTPEAFIVLEKRIQNMSLLHEILYKKEEDTVLNLQDYLQGICETLHACYSTPHTEIKYSISIEDTLPYESASKTGLIINELVTNIYKHAFIGKDKGHYKIHTKKINDTFVLTLTDNGIGLPSDFNINKQSTYGIRLINGLIAQINGTIEFKSTKGKTEFRIII